LLAKEYCDLHSFDNKETISVTLTISDLKIKPYIESIFKNNEDRIDYDCADIDLILKDIPKVKSILNKLKNDKEELDYKIKSFAEKYDLTFDDVEGKLWEEFIANGD
jgi:chromosome segregation and condensation protein ScpB